MRACWLVVVGACGFAPTLAQPDGASGATSDGSRHDSSLPIDGARDAAFVGYAIRYNIGGPQVTRDG